MHYYKHHIGDYRRDTGHLSLLEHGIYRQLLDWYYLEESPIPIETHSVYRRLSARTESEMRAVDAVLADFFTKTADGWINGRCDSEIEEYQGNTEKNRENGKRGGRPKKTQSVSDGFYLGTQAEPNFNPSETLTINHKPETTNQEPFKEQEQDAPCGDSLKKSSSKGSRLPADWAPDEVLLAWAKAERPDLNLKLTVESFRDYWIGKPGKDAVKADWSATFRNWVRREKQDTGYAKAPKPVNQSPRPLL